MTSPGRCPPARGRTQGPASLPSTPEPRLRVRGGHGGEILKEEPSGQTSPALVSDKLSTQQGNSSQPQSLTENLSRQRWAS